MSCGGFHIARAHPAVGGSSRSADPGTAENGARGGGAGASADGAGGAAVGRVASARARAGLGEAKDAVKPRGMARFEDRGVLPARAGGADARGTRPVDGEGGGQLAGGAFGDRAAVALGSATWRFGAGQEHAGAGRWCTVDLERGGGSLEGSDRSVGFLSRQS